MTYLDDAMQEHMAYLVLIVKRPFCYKDFLLFEVNGKEYRMRHGTFRNKVSKLRKEGEVEVVCSSTQTFYTLRDCKLGKPMTPYRMEVRSKSVYDVLQDLPLDKQSIHDIRLKFKAPNIWRLFSIHRVSQK